jgi:hypothetical protein
VRPANDGLRFFLELSALAAVAYWGWTESDGALRWVLVFAAPLAVAAVLARWMAPKSSARVGDPWSLVIELLVFGAAVAGLARAGEPVLAAVLATASAIHLALTFVLGQRYRRP